MRGWLDCAAIFWHLLRMAAFAGLIAQLFDPIRIIMCAAVYWFWLGPVFFMRGADAFMRALLNAVPALTVFLAIGVSGYMPAVITPLGLICGLIATTAWFLIFVFAEKAMHRRAG